MEGCLDPWLGHPIASHKYKDLFETTMTVFWLKWILTSGYTLGFLVIFQMIIPLQQDD